MSNHIETKTGNFLFWIFSQKLLNGRKRLGEGRMRSRKETLNTDNRGCLKFYREMRIWYHSQNWHHFKLCSCKINEMRSVVFKLHVISDNIKLTCPWVNRMIPSSVISNPKASWSGKCFTLSCWRLFFWLLDWLNN